MLKINNYNTAFVSRTRLSLSIYKPFIPCPVAVTAVPCLGAAEPSRFAVVCGSGNDPSGPRSVPPAVTGTPAAPGAGTMRGAWRGEGGRSLPAAPPPALT